MPYVSLEGLWQHEHSYWLESVNMFVSTTWVIFNFGLIIMLSYL